MLNLIQTKALELKHRVVDYLHRDERGQTTAEYVAVTAVAVAIAIGVIFSVLDPALSSAVSNIAKAITDFVSTEV